MAKHIIDTTEAIIQNLEKLNPSWNSRKEMKIGK
jgi:hypothetical protein